MQQKTYWKCVERAGTWLIPEWTVPCPSKVIGTCNPDQGWVKKLFYEPWLKKTLQAPYFYLPASIFDNPYIPQSYIDSLKTLPPEIYRVFVEGSWDAVDAIHQLVPWEAIAACEQPKPSNDHTRSLGADIGRMGSDPTVIVVLDGLNVLDITMIPKTRIDEAANLVEAKAKEYNVSADHCTIDSVGLGGGVVDILASRNFHTIPMVGGSTKHIVLTGGMELTLEELAENTHPHWRFKNWKGYSYWVTAEILKRGEAGNFQDETLRSDATAVWYFTPDDKTIQVESKDDLKTRLGRSPDYWDAYTYAVWSYYAGKLVGDLSLIYTMGRHQQGKKE